MSICAPTANGFLPCTPIWEAASFFLRDRVQSSGIGLAAVIAWSSLPASFIISSVCPFSPPTLSRSLSLLLSSMSCSGSRRCTKTLWAFVSVTWRPATPSWPMSRLTSNQVRDPYREIDELCAFGFQREGCVRYEYIFSRKIGIL